MPFKLTTKFSFLATSAVGFVAASIPLLMGLGKNDKVQKIEKTQFKNDFVELRKQECERQKNRQRADENFRHYWQAGASHYVHQSYRDCLASNLESEDLKTEKIQSKEDLIFQLRKSECKRQESLQKSDTDFWFHWKRNTPHYIRLSYQECMTWNEKAEGHGKWLK